MAHEPGIDHGDYTRLTRLQFELAWRHAKRIVDPHAQRVRQAELIETDVWLLGNANRMIRGPKQVRIDLAKSVLEKLADRCRAGTEFTPRHRTFAAYWNTVIRRQLSSITRGKSRRRSEPLFEEPIVSDFHCWSELILDLRDGKCGLTPRQRDLALLVVAAGESWADACKILAEPYQCSVRTLERDAEATRAYLVWWLRDE